MVCASSQTSLNFFVELTQHQHSSFSTILGSGVVDSSTNFNTEHIAPTQEPRIRIGGLVVGLPCPAAVRSPRQGSRSPSLPATLAHI